MLLKQENFPKIKSNMILLIAGVCFIIILSFFTFSEAIRHERYILYKFNDQLSSIESVLNGEIADAKHIIYGLGTTISENAIILKSNKFIELIHNFDPRHHFDEEVTIPFADISFINSNRTEIVYKPLPHSSNQLRNKDYLDIKICLEEAETEFFKIKTSPLRIGNSVKEPIIPINMAIADSNNNYLGQICSGLIVRELNHKLNSHFGYSRRADGIKIINLNSQNNNQINVIESFSLNKLLKSFLLNEDILFTHKLQKYPFAIEVKLKHTFFRNELYRFVLFSLSIFILFIATIYFLSKNMKNFYEKPLICVQKKLTELNQLINNNNRPELINSEDVSELSSPAKLADSLNEFIASCYPLLLGQSEQTIEQNKLKKKILNLFFVEQHFMSLQKTKIGEDKLYINKLYGLINEEYITLPLYEFLEKLTHYCYEYYHEIGIKSIVEPQDRKSFTFKQTALIEAIFNIFTFILRSAFETGDNHLIMRASFVDNNDFPTITIEANINGCSDPLGWEVGPHFVHTSLLAIYLLAKENNLLFNIIKEGDTIFFILDPIQKKIEFYDLAII